MSGRAPHSFGSNLDGFGRIGAVIDIVATGALLTTGPDAIITHAHPVILALLGHTTQSLVGTSVFDLLIHADPDADVVSLREVTSGRSTSAQVESLVRRSDGSAIRMLIVLTSMSTAADNGFVGFCNFVDVGALGSAAAAVPVSERRFRTIVEASQRGVWISDRDARTTFVNPRMAEMLGTPARNILGRDLLDFMADEDRQIAERNVKRREATINEQHDMKFIRSDGTPIRAFLETVPLADDEGDYDGTLTMVTDTTERRQHLRLDGRFFEMSNDLLATTTPDGRLIDVNPAWTDTLGWSPSELIGRPYLDLVHPDDMDATRAEAARLATQPAITVNFENRYLAKDGEYHWMLWSARSDQDQQTIYAVAKDITLRRAAEDGLRQSERVLRRMVDANVIGIIVADTAGRIWEANEAFCTMLGWTQGEVLAGAMRWDELTPPGWESADAAAVESLMTTRSFVNLEKEYLHRSGEIVPVLVGGALLDEVLGTCVCFVLDLTERKRAQLEIMRLNEQLETRILERTRLLKAVHDAQSHFIVQDEPGQVFDDLIEVLLELSGSKYGFIDELFHDSDGTPHLLARAITDIAWNDETSAIYRRFLDGSLTFDNMSSLFGTVVTTGRAVISNDAPNDPLRCGVPSGHPPLEAFLGIPLWASGELMGMIGLANRAGGYDHATIESLDPIATACANILWAERNRDQRRRTETALVESNEALSRANAELESFTYSVSHDLRAPLRAMTGFARLLITDAPAGLSEEHRHYLDRIATNAARLGDLIDDLLTLSRVGRQGLNMTAVLPGPVVEHILEVFADELKGRNVNIEVGDLPPCRADRQLLGLVFQNLLGNAIKFTNQHPAAHIAVSGAATPGCGVTYEVRDNGIGFHSDYADKLFQVFQRLHTNDEFEGTGVGLAIVEQIVRRHGGTVAADGRPGEGAVFRFTIPGVGNV